MNKVCILSHGRSGTVYTATVLNKIGIKIGHEVHGKDGTVGGTIWKSSKRRTLADYNHVLHQVRNPLAAISSITTVRQATLRRYCSEIGFPHCIIPTDRLEAAMLSWVMFTTWADDHAEWVFQVEDMPKIFGRLCHYFGVTSAPELPVIGKDLNSRHHPLFTMTDLRTANCSLAEMVYFKGIQYGYWRS